MDLGAAIGKLLSIALPPVLSLQISVHDLAATERTSVFRTISAEVTNWRLQAVTSLDLPMKSGTLLLLGSPVTRMPRCVKLNNYWCIKRAGWQGELGADAEGHVAFDTADAGARAAAILLRRYYLEFGRRSALAIVSRWAPNRCMGSGALVASGRALPTFPSLTGWQRMSKEQRDQTFERLMIERRRVSEARYKATMQAIAARRMASFPRPKPKPPTAAAATPTQPLRSSKAASPKRVTTIAPISCALEAARISSYARRAIVGIAATPSQDLELFDERGAATWRMARLMTNMASVEIGPHRVGPTLIPSALAALAEADDPSTIGANLRHQASPEGGRPMDLPAVGSEIPPS